jgi:ADP-dependent phosphofructokinase/glucokinase
VFFLSAHSKVYTLGWIFLNRKCTEKEQYKYKIKNGSEDFHDYNQKFENIHYHLDLIDD